MVTVQHGTCSPGCGRICIAFPSNRVAELGSSTNVHIWAMEIEISPCKNMKQSMKNVISSFRKRQQVSNMCVRKTIDFPNAARQINGMIPSIFNIINLSSSTYCNFKLMRKLFIITGKNLCSLIQWLRFLRHTNVGSGSFLVGMLKTLLNMEHKLERYNCQQDLNPTGTNQIPGFYRKNNFNIKYLVMKIDVQGPNNKFK